jgi:hypothetical protein
MSARVIAFSGCFIEVRNQNKSRNRSAGIATGAMDRDFNIGIASTIIRRLERSLLGPDSQATLIV